MCWAVRDRPWLWRYFIGPSSFSFLKNIPRLYRLPSCVGHDATFSSRVALCAVAPRPAATTLGADPPPWARRARHPTSFQWPIFSTPTSIHSLCYAMLPFPHTSPIHHPPKSVQSLSIHVACHALLCVSLVPTACIDFSAVRSRTAKSIDATRPYMQSLYRLRISVREGRERI